VSGTTETPTPENEGAQAQPIVGTQQDGQTTTPETTGAESTSTETTTPTSTESAEPFDVSKLEVPNNFQLADEDKEALQKLASDNNLSHDAMAALAKFHFDKLGATAETFNAQAQKEWEQTHQDWQQKVFQKYGGEDATRQLVKSKIEPFIEKFGGNDVLEALTVTGAANHPAIVDMFMQLADSFGEGTPVTTTAAGQGEDPFRSAFPNSPGLFGDKR